MTTTSTFPSLHSLVRNAPRLLLTTLLAWTLLPGAAQAALEVKCSVPQEIVCDVHDPDGFLSVWVEVDFGNFGKINVVEQNFASCQTDTTVEWDPTVPDYDIIAMPCDGAPFPGFDPSKFLKVDRGFKIEFNKTSNSLAAAPIEPTPLALVNGAIGRMERLAKRQALVIDGAGLRGFETGDLTANFLPIAELDAEDDIRFPIDVMLIDVLSQRSDLPSGTYRVRLDLNGRETVGRMSLVDESGTVAFRSATEPLSDDPALSGFDSLLNQGNAQAGKICGKKKCLVWKRIGFLKWKFGCINKFTGAVVACAGD